MLPDRLIGSGPETYIADMATIRIVIRQRPDEPAARFSSKSGLICRLGNRNGHEPALALSGECQAGADVFERQLREIGQDFRFVHARCEVREDIADGNACPAHAWLAEPDLGVDDNSVSGSPCPKIRPGRCPDQGCPSTGSSTVS